MQIFPKGALATSVYLRWTEIPVAEQGGGLNNYEISYWVKGQPRAINKTDFPIERPTADADGYISYEIKNIQTGLEYLVAVYGENKYSTDVLDRSYYSSEIFAKPSVRRMLFRFICLKGVKVDKNLELFFKLMPHALKYKNVLRLFYQEIVPNNLNKCYLILHCS